MKINFLLFFITLFIGASQAQIMVYESNGMVTVGAIGQDKGKIFKLKKDKISKAIKFKCKDLDSVVVVCDGPNRVFHSIGKKGYLFELVDRGKVNIYTSQSTTVTAYGAFSSTFYYLKRTEEDGFADLYNRWKFFSKLAEEYFTDCPSLVEKIKNEEEGFGRNDLLNIGRYYNTHCGNL